MQLIDEGKTNTAVVNHYSLIHLALSEPQVSLVCVCMCVSIAVVDHYSCETHTCVRVCDWCGATCKPPKSVISIDCVSEPRDLQKPPPSDTGEGYQTSWGPAENPQV